VADRAGVGRAKLASVRQWSEESDRTTYLFDVRTPEEFAAGHLPGTWSVPGGQLVQETDHYAAVRGARIVLIDDDGVRANMTGSWLAQMGWETHVVDGLSETDFSTTGAWRAPQPIPTSVQSISPQRLKILLDQGDGPLLDVGLSANYVKGHIPGAAFVLRAQIGAALEHGSTAKSFVVTCGSGLLARFAAADLQSLTDLEIYVLDGGTAAWAAAGYPLETGEQRLLSPRIDRYRRPYEGTDNPREAMQAYLDWEFGLVEQLARDGTHGFKVI
jgi:rhodanese-related sulfurtransferase